MAQVTAVKLSLDLKNENYKDTKKLTWLAESAQEKSVPVLAVEFEPLITKAHVTKVNSIFILFFDRDYPNSKAINAQ